MSGELVALGFFILVGSAMCGAGFKTGVRLIGAIVTVVGLFWVTIIAMITQALLIAAVVLFVLAIVAVIRSLLRHRRVRRQRQAQWPHDPYGPGNPYDWH